MNNRKRDIYRQYTENQNKQNFQNTAYKGARNAAKHHLMYHRIQCNTALLQDLFPHESGMIPKEVDGKGGWSNPEQKFQVDLHCLPDDPMKKASTYRYCFTILVHSISCKCKK
jgi:hypothetical protein